MEIKKTSWHYRLNKFYNDDRDVTVTNLCSYILLTLGSMIHYLFGTLFVVFALSVIVLTFIHLGGMIYTSSGLCTGLDSSYLINWLSLDLGNPSDYSKFGSISNPIDDLQYLSSLGFTNLIVLFLVGLVIGISTLSLVAVTVVGFILC